MSHDQQHTHASPSASKTRICVVGAGAAGIAATWALSRNPDRFHVELWEKGGSAGGVAQSETIDASTSPATGERQKLWINDGVQGGSTSYRNVHQLLQQWGFETKPVHMKISFGKDDTYWNNTHETPLVRRLQPDIERFGRILRWIHRLEPLFVFVPIDKVLLWFGFSAEFRNQMVFPLTALFFGTGNQTPNVSAAIVARVFLDPELRLFDYDPRLLLSQTPQMFAFPSLGAIYAKAVSDVQSRGAEVFFGRGVKQVARALGKVHITDESGQTSVFDHVIFACDAETALRTLARPSLMEKWVLGNVQYYDDVTITHQDVAYMKRHYEVDAARRDQYFIRTHPVHPDKLEMSFNLSNYQPQLRGPAGADGTAPDDAKLQTDIFQTIFLDKKEDALWTIAEIDPSKILARKWWHQFAHTWRHFALTVPFIQFLQGRQNTWFCGSYTLVNTHEIAVISGLAAAHRLGAPYPFGHDGLAQRQFANYLNLAHGAWMVKARWAVSGLLLGAFAVALAVFLR